MSRPSTALVHLLRRALAALDHGALRVETHLAAAVLLLEILVLCLWAVLKGLSTPIGSESLAGLLFRAVAGAAALGAVCFVALRGRSPRIRGGGVMVALLLGAAAAPLWRGVGVGWASNVLNWTQQSSTLTLFGGLRGVGTRLTMLLGLVGAAMAAGRGKHVTIDLVTRWVSPRIRHGLELASWVLATAICGVVGWGFFDFVSIDVFGAVADARPAEKIERVIAGLGDDAFILSRQLQLDLASFRPIVVDGVPYASWVDSERWSRWISEMGLAERYGSEAARALEIPAGTTRAPLIVVPGLGEPHGELARAANLVLPFGLWAIGLAMLLRALRVVVDPVGMRTEPDTLTEVQP